MSFSRRTMKWLAVGILVLLFALVYWAGANGPDWLGHGKAAEQQQHKPRTIGGFCSGSAAEVEKCRQEWRIEQLEHEVDALRERQNGAPFP